MDGSWVELKLKFNRTQICFKFNRGCKFSCKDFISSRLIKETSEVKRAKLLLNISIFQLMFGSSS